MKPPDPFGYIKYQVFGMPYPTTVIATKTMDMLERLPSNPYTPKKRKK